MWKFPLGLGLILCFGTFLTLMSCQEEIPKDNLVISRTDIEIQKEGGSATVILQTNAEDWRIQNPTDWITLSQPNGTETEISIVLTVNSKTPEERIGILTVIAGTANRVEITVSQNASEFLYTISSNYDELRFKKGGNNYEIEVSTDAPEWQIGSEVDWLQFEPTEGSAGTSLVKITAKENVASEDRETLIKLTAIYTSTKEINAFQISEYYPNYNISPLPPDITGMSSTAIQLASKMTLGINIGNTLEAIGGETAWGNPKINKTLIDALKGYGFTAIRLPCSYSQYADAATAEIQTAWLDRVKEVIQYCVDNDLYVLLNIHWDQGWLEHNITPDKQEEVNAKQKAFWEQIATHMRGFDEHLMFASANEPIVDNAPQMNVLKTYNQTFIDAVRSTGGKNSYRTLVLQGATTDEDINNLFLAAFPQDEVEKRLMIEVHYYSPYQFCLMSEDADWGKMFYFWGEGYHSVIDPTRNSTWGEEAYMVSNFEVARSQFLFKGYPIILGEFGAYKRNNMAEQALHDASVEYFNKHVVKTALSKGMIPFYWDTGGIINRSNGAVKDQGVLDALFEGAQ